MSKRLQIKEKIEKAAMDCFERYGLDKTTLEDMRTLGQLVEEGLVVPPRYLPEPFADLNALSAWMCFSGFLTNLSLDRIEADYANIL